MASFEQIEDYAERHTRALSDLHARLWEETHQKTDSPGMMVGPIEGALLKLLVRLTAAKRVLEIGMFTGYSALAMAEALPEDGQLITCDVNPETTAIARRYFAESAHTHKIEIKLGPARETLKAEPLREIALRELVRPGGLIVLDNMLRSGRVLSPRDQDTRTVAALNDRIQKDERVENVLLPIRDGVMLAYRR